MRRSIGPNRLHVTAWLLLGSLLAASSAAALPAYSAYQGFLSDPAGQPLDGTVELVVTAYETAASSEVLYLERHSGVAVRQGVFEIQLGAGTVLGASGDPAVPPFGAWATAALARETLFLELSVDGELLAPRQAIATVPYCVVAEEAKFARAIVGEGLDGASITDATVTPEKLALPSIRFDGGEPLQVDGDVVFGGGASAFDGFSEFVSVRGRFQSWSLGVLNSAASDFFIGTAPGDISALRIDRGGNVGINFLANSPLRAPLHVGCDFREDPAFPCLLLEEYGIPDSPYLAMGPWFIDAVEDSGAGANLDLNPSGGLVSVSGGLTVSSDFLQLGQRFIVDGTARFNRNVGVGVLDPLLPLHVATGTPIALRSGGFAMVGTTSAPHLVFDSTSIAARNAVADPFPFATLHLQPLGGGVEIHGPTYVRNSLGLDVDGPISFGAGGQLSADGSGVRVGASVGNQLILTAAGNLDVPGETSTEVLRIRGGSDLSEQFDVAPEEGEVEPGTVVCVHPEREGALRICTESHDRTVVGVVSGAGGVQPGMRMGQPGTLADGDVPVALTGRVYVKADASGGPIRPGDLLTTSKRAGHARRVTDHGRATGAVLGKAMTALDEEDGLVLAVVSLL